MVKWQVLTPLLLAACDEAPAPALLPTATVRAGEAALHVEIAADPASRERGLMFRRTLDEDAGMLFVYPEAKRLGFWMKNTFVPLSVAFVAEDGRVVSIDRMAPFDETPHWSPEPVPWAIEAPDGWFEAHGVAPGDRVDVDLPPALPVR